MLLAHVRATLGELGDDAHRPERRVVRELPTGRLAGGEGRDRAASLVASDPHLWRLVRARLAEDPLGAQVLAALTGPDVHHDDPEAPTTSSSRGSPGTGRRAREQALQDARRRAKRDRQRLEAVRSERDEARRRAELEGRRARSLEEELTEGNERIGSLERKLADLRRDLDAADRQRERAVDRERRRRDGDLAVLREQLAQLRREQEDRRERDRRRTDRARSEAPRSAAEAGEAGSAGRHVAPTRLVPGRPSQLPPGVVPGTREAVELYLHRGRRVLIDGYNVSLRRHADLDLEQQRHWLVGAVGNLARSRGIRPTVVFDSQRPEGRRGASSAREVAVRFTDAGITADDEIVLEVEATDEPILVITDDRELSARVRASGADVVGSTQLLWLL